MICTTQTFYIFYNLLTSLTLFHHQMISLKYIYMFWQKSETLYSSVCNGIRSVTDELSLSPCIPKTHLSTRRTFKAIPLYLPLSNSL
jgi:hypothetical protein